MKQLNFIAILFLVLCSISFAQANKPPCVGLRITSSDIQEKDGNFLPNINESRTLSAETTKEIENYQVTYHWTVSGGKILSGQNTKTITFIRDGYTLIVLVEIKGLPPNCENRAEVASVIDRSNQLIDEYEQITKSEERKKIDKFFTEVQKNLPTFALIKLKDDKNLKQHLIFLHSYIESKGQDINQIGYLIGNEPDERTQLWLVYPGVGMPPCKDCLFIKAKDIGEFIKSISSKSLSTKQ